MKLKGKQVHYNVEIEVDLHDALHDVLKQVFLLHKIPVDSYIDDKGRLVVYEDSYHGSGDTRVVTSWPTEDQITLVNAARTLIQAASKAG